MSGGNTIRRRTLSKELRLSQGYVKTKEEYESQNVKYMGSVGAAAKQGYFTIAACERKGVPVSQDELQNIRYFAMLADCYVDQCITDETGSKRRPCIPVFYREQEQMTLQERLAMTQGQDNGMDIILGGIPAAAQQEQVQQLPATALRPKSNHTFKVRTGSPHYTALVDSIRSSGIRTPLLVRRDPVQPGAYEIIAGHTRWTAAQELELATVPCIVAQLSDADADIMMAETNIQRPDWLPSERAKTYKVWLEAVQTETGITQGQRTDTTSGTECPKLGRNRDVAAQRFGIGPKTLDMYIKLNDLIPELLDMVDANAVDSKTGIQVKAGYQLAFLSPNSQQVVVAVLADNPKILLKEAQAKTLRQAETDGRLTALDAEEALGLSGEQLPHRTKRISISISEELLPEGAKQLTKDPAFQDALTAWIRQYIEKEVKA